MDFIARKPHGRLLAGIRQVLLQRLQLRGVVFVLRLKLCHLFVQLPDAVSEFAAGDAAAVVGFADAAFCTAVTFLSSASMRPVTLFISAGNVLSAVSAPIIRLLRLSTVFCMPSSFAMELPCARDSEFSHVCTGADQSDR